jgi:hypothetical protein
MSDDLRVFLLRHWALEDEQDQLHEQIGLLCEAISREMGDMMGTTNGVE